MCGGVAVVAVLLVRNDDLAEYHLAKIMCSSCKVKTVIKVRWIEGIRVLYTEPEFGIEKEGLTVVMHLLFRFIRHVLIGTGILGSITMYIGN
jgi:hypothetical protein